MAQPSFVKRIQEKERKAKERKKQRKKEKREKKKVKAEDKKFVEQTLTQKILVTEQKPTPTIKVKKRKKPKVFKIPTTETLKKRTPQEIGKELQKAKTEQPQVRQLVAKGFKREEAKQKLELERQQRLKKALKIMSPKQKQQFLVKEKLIKKVFKREPAIIPEVLQTKKTFKKPMQLQKQGIKGLQKLGFQEGNIKKFITKVTEQRKQKAKAREDLIDNSVQSFIKRTNLQDTEENKNTIKQAVKTIGIDLPTLNRINNVKELQNRITDFTTEGLYRYGTSVLGLNPNEVRQFAINRNVEGLNQKIKEKVEQIEKGIRFDQKLTDFQRADKLANFYNRAGIAKPITLNKIPYYVVGKDGKLKSAFEKVAPVSVSNNNRLLSGLVRDNKLKTIPVDNVNRRDFNTVIKWFSRGIDAANKGASAAIVKKEVNFDEMLGKKDFVMNMGKALFNLVTAVPRATKKAVFFEIDTLTKKVANDYKKELLKKGYDHPDTQIKRKGLLTLLNARQKGLKDIRTIDPTFDENKLIIMDPDIIDTALLLVGAPLISRGIAKLELGAQTLARSTKPMASLVGRWSAKGIKASQLGFVGAQVGIATVKPNVENISNVLLIGGDAIRGTGKLINKITTTKLKKTSKLRQEIQTKQKELKEKGISPRERQFKEAQELNLLKTKLIKLEEKEISLLNRLDKLRKTISLNRGKKPTSNQQNLVKNVKLQSKSTKKKKKKIEQKLEDFEKKIKKKPKKEKTTQKEIRERIDTLIKQAKKTGKKTNLKNLLLFIKALNKPSIMKTIKSDLKKAGFKFTFKKSEKTGKTFVDLKKITKAEEKILKPKISAKDKKILREIEKRPKREEVGIRRLKQEIEIVKRTKRRASEKALKEDIEQGIKNALKKSIAFRQEIILGVKKSSLTRKQVDKVVDSVLKGIRKPKTIEDIKKRFNNQIKQIQMRKAVLKQQLNKMIGFSQITEKGFTVLKKKSRKVIPKIKKSLNDLDNELKRINSNKSEFFNEVKKNKLDIVKTSKELDELQFARRQKEFKEKAKNVKIKFERDFNVKPKVEEATMKIFLGKKLGTIEVFFKAPKTRGLAIKGKKAELRPVTIFKEPVIKFKHKSFSPKQIELVKSKAGKQIRQDPRKRRADNLFDNGRKQRRKIKLLSKPRKGVKLSQTSKRRAKILERRLDLIEDRLKRLRLRAIGLAIANTFGFNTANDTSILNSNLTQIAKAFKDIQTNVNDLQRQIVKEFKKQTEKKAPPKKKLIKKTIAPPKKLPPKLVRKPIIKPKRKVIKKPPIKIIEKKRLRLPLLTWNTKLPKGYRLSFNALYRERRDPKKPQHPKTNPVRVKKIPLNLPINRALKNIAQGVDRTNPRSFRLQISGITKKKDIAKPTQLLKKYRFRKTKNALDTVEKSKFAIDTRGEKKGLSLSRYVKKRLKKTPQTIRKKRSKPKKTKRSRKR